MSFIRSLTLLTQFIDKCW